jgi:A/G-specific adenine glycosylase
VESPHLKSKAIVKGLLRWFESNKRSFPWRETFEEPDPYIILFTEIMLQRTRADQVVPVYSEFINRYPTFEDLARAKKSQVVALFSKLGLTWRAKNVFKLIRVLESQYRGRVPSDVEMLRELPAVGLYVAKAVSCYAYGTKLVPVDTNVVRVISRLFGLPGQVDSARRSRSVTKLADSLAPEANFQDFNLALLDFAAKVCRPKPLCEICPLQKQCHFYSHRSTTDSSLIS